MPGSGPRHAFGLGPRILKQTEHHHVTEDQPLTSKCPCEARRLHVATLMKRMGQAGKRHGFERTREGGALPQAQHLETGTSMRSMAPP